MLKQHSCQQNDVPIPCSCELHLGSETSLWPARWGAHVHACLCRRCANVQPSPIHCCGCHVSVAVACADEPCPQPLWPYVRLGSAGRMRTSAAYTELRTVLQRPYAHISVRMAHNGRHCAAEAIRSQSVRMAHNGKHCAAEAAAGYVSKIATTTGMPPNQVRTSLQVVVFIEGRCQGS